MRYLLVDTADARGFLAVCREDRISHLAAHPAEQDYSSWLLPSAADVLKKSGLSLTELDAYAVCCGPGSFTGLRVGLTTVKAWAAVYPRPVVAVSRLEALGAIPLPEAAPPAGFVAAYIDAQRGQVFAAVYTASPLDPVEGEAVTSLAKFVEKVEENSGDRAVLWRTPDPQLLESLPQWGRRRRKGDVLQTMVPPFAAPLAALAYQKLKEGEVTDALSLDANYIRRSDAEIFWKGNSGAAKI
jgi:tRNA threonylcarbamoyladenosine biosynthesis protein TsaB